MWVWDTCRSMMYPEYLQNFPGGQGKHSLSSCSPPWCEWVYVPLGQGWGTIVPKKRQTDRNIIYFFISVNLFWMFQSGPSYNPIQAYFPFQHTCRAEWVRWAGPWLSHYGLLTVVSRSAGDAIIWTRVWLVFSCGTRQGQGRSFWTIVALG